MVQTLGMVVKMTQKEDYLICKIEQFSKDKPLHKTIGRYFLLFSAILLITPFFNPLANPLNNPNTSYENYPFALQQVFAETIVSTERGKDYQIEKMANGNYVWKNDVIPYIYDASTNQYVDHLLSTNASHITVKSEQLNFSFKKADCTFVIYTDTTLRTKFYDYYSTMALKPSGQSWSVYDALSLACTRTTIQNATGIFEEVTRTHAKGEFKTTYTKLKDGYFKSYPQFKNAQSPTGFQNTKVSFVDVIGNLTVSKFLVDGLDKFAQLPIGTQVIYTQSNMTNKVFNFISKANLPFKIDLGDDYPDLLGVRATKNANGLLDLEIAFGATASNLQYGQVVQNDPTYGFTASTHFAPITPPTTTTECVSINADSEFAPTTLVINVPDKDVSSNCIFSSFRNNVASIDNSADVSQVRMKFSNISGGTSPRNCDITIVDPAPSSDDNRYDKILAGTTVLNNDSFCTTTGEKTVTLSSDANTHVESQLTGDDLVEFGVHFDDDSRTSGTVHSVSITADTSVSLEITYSVATAQQVKFRMFENDGSTAVSSATVIVKNSTTTASLTTNSTGVTGIFGIKSATNHNVTAKTDGNLVFYKQFNWQPTANQTETRTGNIFDVTGCDATISNLIMNETDTHKVTVATSPTCSNDVLTFNYYFAKNGQGSTGSNKTTSIRFEVPNNSVYARNHVGTVNGSAVTFTYASGILTSGTIQVDNGANNVILKVTINLRGIHRVVSYENDKSTLLTSGNVIWKNSTTSQTFAINSTGFVQLDGITGSGNITQKETVDNFVTNKTYGLQLAGNIGLIGLIFDGSCPQNGAGNDFQFKINATNYHRISSHTTPTCATTGNNLNVTTTVTFTADGNASSLTNQTSLIDIDIGNTTAFGKNLIRLRANGTAIPTTYSAGEITSETIQIAHGMKTVVLNINFALDPKPSIPSNPTGTCDTDSCTPTWSAPASGVSGITSYTLQYKTDSTDWANLVTQSGTSYEHTGLTASTNYYYRVLATNSYGSSAYSEQGSGTTTSGGSITGGSSGGSSPSQNNLFGQALDTIFNLSIFGKEKLLSFGEIDKTGQIVVKWTVKDEIQVNQILYDVPEGFTFTPATPPFVLEKQPDGTRENYIPYTIIAPRKCDPENPKLELRVTENCQKAGLYKISVSIGVSESGVFTTQATEIPIRLGEAIFDPAMLARYSIFLVPSVIIVGFVAQHYIRKTKRTSAKKTIAKHHKNHTRKK